ncbi:MAG: hypothetical protein OXG34_07660 [bacterium]|nr:hypothetical protein [bacterium]
MSSPQVAPWGSPPTPVLPRWFIDSMPSKPLAHTLRRRGPEGEQLKVVADLERFWSGRSQPLNKQERTVLLRIARRAAWPPDDLTVLPAGIDLDHLLACPLKVRTLNCIQREMKSQTLPPDDALTVGSFLKLRNFGIISLVDLMCVVETAITNGFLCASVSYPAHSPHQSASAGFSAVPSPEPPDPLAIAWEPAVAVLRRLLAASAELNDAQTLADALNGNLGKLAFNLGMTRHLEGIAISGLTGSPALAQETLKAFTKFRESLKPLERSILEKRLLAAKPLTLEELGKEANLTRERIRQIEKMVESRLNHPSITGPAVKCWIGVLAALVSRQLGPITGPNNLEKRIAATFPCNSTSDESESTIAKMARFLLRKELDYMHIGGIYLDKTAVAVIDAIKALAQSIADEVGLISESELEDRLPDATCHLPENVWQESVNQLLDQHWDQLLEQCGLHQLCGQLALRDTSKARAMAALLSVGRPATKEEIGKLSGLRPDRAGAQLSLLPGVVRADKARWGLAEWIDDEYEGIPAEIIQRINEDGGTTRLNRLLEELPRMFGVSKASVRAYLDTPAFRVEHGWVSAADDHGLLLGRLEDVIDGYDDGGDPYWEFEIEDRHLDGYSLHGVPFELAIALECEFGGKSAARVRKPEGCQDISVIWRKTSMHGPEIGRLGPSLAAIGAQGGDEVRLLIHNQHEVSFEREQRGSAGRREHQLQRSFGTTQERQNTPFGGVKMGEPISGRLSTEARVCPATAEEGS